MEPFLIRVGFGDRIDQFKEMGIDDDSFMLLAEEPSLLKEIFPLAGPRLLFKKAYSELHVKEAKQVTHDLDSDDGPVPKKSKLSKVPATASDGESDDSAPEGPAHWKPGENVQESKDRNAMDIAHILRKDPCGDAIVKEIEETGGIGGKSRCKMVRILVSHLIKKYTTTPRTSEKILVARSIVTQFPALKDTEGEGYEHFFTKSRGSHSATGYLEERLKNVRRRMPKIEEPSTSSQGNAPTCSKGNPSKRSSPFRELTEEEEEDAKEKKRWCQHNNSPKEQVLEYMRATSQLRRKEVLQGSKTLLIDWPRLLDSPAMIEEDFRNLYGRETADGMTQKWTEGFAAKVKEYGLKQKTVVTRVLKEDGKDDHQAVLQTLPLFLPTGKVKKSSGKTVLATPVEALQAFIDQKPIGTNLAQYTSDVATCGNRPQPFVLVIGERTSPSQGESYVIVEGQAMKAESLLKAVDVCFKFMYVLDMHYPTQCTTTWEFLQKVIYQIKDEKKESTSPSVRSLRAYLYSQKSEV